MKCPLTTANFVEREGVGENNHSYRLLTLSVTNRAAELSFES